MKAILEEIAGSEVSILVQWLPIIVTNVFTSEELAV